ncbi:MAG TPA: GspH/FimT family pseudopilin, partial [Burkholderiales bacterium]|nr:GspH/FimT family pseudopilin [Burkholderiales bacterium]
MMNRPYISGFTLLELIVAMGVAAILLAISVPNFQTIFNSNRVVTVANDYMTALNYARSQAVKGGAITTICMSNNGSACTGSSGWSNGWIVWSDLNSNGVMDTGELMQSHGPI